MKKYKWIRRVCEQLEQSRTLRRLAWTALALYGCRIVADVLIALASA